MPSPLRYFTESDVAHIFKGVDPNDALYQKALAVVHAKNIWQKWKALRTFRAHSVTAPADSLRRFCLLHPSTYFPLRRYLRHEDTLPEALTQWVLRRLSPECTASLARMLLADKSTLEEKRDTLFPKSEDPNNRAHKLVLLWINTLNEIALQKPTQLERLELSHCFSKKVKKLTQNSLERLKFACFFPLPQDHWHDYLAYKDPIPDAMMEHIALSFSSYRKIRVRASLERLLPRFTEHTLQCVFSDMPPHEKTAHPFYHAIQQVTQACRIARNTEHDGMLPPATWAALFKAYKAIQPFHILHADSASGSDMLDWLRIRCVMGTPHTLHKAYKLQAPLPAPFFGWIWDQTPLAHRASLLKAAHKKNQPGLRAIELRGLLRTSLFAKPKADAPHHTLWTHAHQLLGRSDKIDIHYDAFANAYRDADKNTQQQFLDKTSFLNPLWMKHTVAMYCLIGTVIGLPFLAAYWLYQFCQHQYTSELKADSEKPWLPESIATQLEQLTALRP